jgi:tetratricopeptide (TPR) repeat protein
MVSPATRSRFKWWGGLVLVLMLFGAACFTQTRVDRELKARGRKLDDDMMYFPSGRLLEPIAGEYGLVVADYAWLRAIQYYAYHLVRDANYEWFAHIIRVVTSLDPLFIEAYRFGAFVLSWDMDRPEDAIQLLREGMQRNPVRWELPFEAAFVAYTKLKDYDRAAYYFDLAARLPDVWTVAPRMAAVASARAGNYELAREIWTQLLLTHPNEKLRDIARRQLVDLLGQELKDFQAAADRYTAEQGCVPLRFEQLVHLHYLEQVPQDPMGGRWLLRQGQVVSSGLQTAKQQLALLQNVVQRYARERGGLPAELDILVQDGYLERVPELPLGLVPRLKDGKVTASEELP